MSGLLSLEQTQTLMLLQALGSDDAQKQRVAAILAANADAAATLEEVRKERSENEAMLAQARAEKAQALDLVQEADRKLAGFADRETALREVSEGLNREKAAWEAVRQKVDAEQAAQTRHLGEWHKSLDERELAVGLRENRCAEREDAAEALKSAYWAKHQRLADALAESRTMDDWPPRLSPD